MGGIRALVNAYGEWLDRMDEGDSFDGLKSILSMAAVIIAALLIILAPIVIAIAIAMAHEPPHGSCKIGHRQFTGKTTAFVCDEYCPVPKQE